MVQKFQFVKELGLRYWNYFVRGLSGDVDKFIVRTILRGQNCEAEFKCYYDIDFTVDELDSHWGLRKFFF